MSKNITIYLLSSLDILIGKDDGKQIKEACKVFQTSQGPAIASLFMNITGKKEHGMSIDKKQLTILKTGEPAPRVIEGYIQFLSGERPQEPKIIVPKHLQN